MRGTLVGLLGSAGGRTRLTSPQSKCAAWGRRKRATHGGGGGKRERRGWGAWPTAAQASAKGPGLYEGTGVLESGGTWQVTVTVKLNGHVVGTQQLRINAEGGM